MFNGSKTWHFYLLCAVRLKTTTYTYWNIIYEEFCKQDTIKYIKATQYWKCKFLISEIIPLPNDLDVGYTQAISWGVLWLFLIIISCFCTALSKRQWTANGSKLRYDVLDTSFKASSQCPRFSNCPLVSFLYFKTHLQH